MGTMEKKWRIHTPDEQAVEAVAQGTGLSALAAKILVTRGYTTADEALDFLRTDEEVIHDPYLLHDLEGAVARIQRAIEQQENIVVYGDYDADGITSSTVMKTALQQLGAVVEHVIPNRFEHGYGPNEALFREIAEAGANLLITVDNGIAGNGPIDVIKSLGVDVIVTDHHEPGKELPNADFIIHPRHPEGNYPFGELAGVGVAFKVAQALLGRVPEELIDVVAIGTVADLVPLVDENRYFVIKGLERMRHHARPAIQALATVAGTELSDIDEQTIGFGFGPRLNALGRLGDATPGVDFLMMEQQTEAMHMANYLNERNKERQDLVAAITEEAIDMVETIPEVGNSRVLVVAGEGWNAGVVGIVASRLVEKYYRPTIVLATDSEKGIAKGSARSIEGFNMYVELDKNRDILPAFGGHPMAAGMTLQQADVDELRSRLHTQALDCLSEEDLVPVLNIDIPLNVEEIDLDALDDLKKLAPFGVEFEKPLYGLRDLSIKSMRKIGANEDHIKMEIGKNGHYLDAVGFHKGYLADELTPGIDISFAGDIQINEWNGRRKPQFMLQDVHTDAWQLFDIRGGHKISQWLAKIDADQTTFLAFRKDTIAHYTSVIPREIKYYDEEDTAEAYEKFIVLLDLPQNVQQLEHVIALEKLERIYAHFYVSDPHLFDGMPTREQFVWYYAFLRKRREFHLHQNLNTLAKHKGWSRAMLIFMTQVFFELEFVTIENGLAKIVDNPPKRDLTSAAIYKERTQQLALEKTLLYAPYKDLRQWFDERIHQTVSEEEQ